MDSKSNENPTQEQVQTALADFLRDSDAEKRLYDVLEKLPNKRIIAGHKGRTILVEQDYNRDRVRVQRDVTVLGGVS